MFFGVKCAIFGVSLGHLRGEVVPKNHATKVQQKSDIRKFCCTFAPEKCYLIENQPRIFVQIFIAVTFSTQNLHIRKFCCVRTSS